MIKSDLGQVDLVVYSLASPRRTHPKTGVAHASVLKPISQPFTDKTVDFHTGVVSDITIQPVENPEDIENTVAVMGGRLEILDRRVESSWRPCRRCENCSVLVYRP